MRMLLNRLRVLIPTLFLITILTFSLRALIPGGVAEALASGSSNPDTIRMINERFGLDRPLWIQYFDWLGGLLRGDLGISYANGVPVWDVIAPRLGSTLEVVAFGAVVALLGGGALGMYAAIARDSRWGRFVFAASGLGVSIPVFWLATLCAGVLGATLGWLPVNGYTPWSEGFIPHVKSLLMPVVLVAVPATALMVRHVRSAMGAALESAYVRTAWAMGINSKRIYFDLALRNALGPIVTFVPFLIATLVGELVIIDVVFVLPGLGSAILDAVTFRDYSTLQAIVLMLAVAVVVLSMLADIIMVAIDPRRRKGNV